MSCAAVPLIVGRTMTALSRSLPFQPLTVTAPSLTIAENMADLIDGYCRLVNGASQSFIIRPQKGEPVCVCVRASPPALPPCPRSLQSSSLVTAERRPGGWLGPGACPVP